MRFFFVFFLGLVLRAYAEQDIHVLFLGDNGHHQPKARASELIPAMAERGIEITYTDNLEDLNPDTLAQYDALIIYANQEVISPEQEKALLDYVANGGGFVPLHCASYCFHNSPEYIKLVGAQFARHGTGEFVAEIIDRSHPITSSMLEFRTWDETYVHTKQNPDRQVLMQRKDEHETEAWTWVRTQGKGRIFYTAYGHDARTFTHPGFHKLVENGIRWVSRRELPAMEKAAFEYQDAKIAFYPPKDAHGIIQDAPTQMQLPLSPEESMKHLLLPANFEAKIYAAEPEVYKVITMNWDERGRLWIAETLDYPNELKPAPLGQDRIRICEDTNGDGHADKYTLFADKLSIPTSLIFANDGLIVAQVPDILFLKDTDGDGVADLREVLITGWRNEDTHSGPSNLRMGFDNWIWGSVGYSGFDGVVNGKAMTFSMGVFRFKPDGSELEYISSTTNNTWGLGISETGEVFVSTANGDHHDHMAIPNRYFEKVRGYAGRGTVSIYDHKNIHPITPNVRQVDWHGQFSSAAGCAIYTARAYPESYWNRVAFITEPTGHLVHECILEPQGSGFIAHDGWNLLASTDEWHAPILAEVGPDGHVWVSDWYNYIVQHNPTPQGFENGPGNAYITPLRDKTHGRIYRIVHNKADSEPMPDLHNASDDLLLETLSHGNMFWRMMAQRLIVESDNQALIPELESMTRIKKLDSIGNCPVALHALSALDGLNYFKTDNSESRKTIKEALNHPAPAVRRRAAQLAPQLPGMSSALLALLKDNEQSVQLQALLALSEIDEDARVGEGIAALLKIDNIFTDPWLPVAVTMAGAQHAESFLKAAGSHSEYSNNADNIAEVIYAVANHYARGETHTQLATLFSTYVNAQTPLSRAFLNGLMAGWPEDQTPDQIADMEKVLLPFSEKSDTEILLAAATLARRWKLDVRFDDRLDALRARLQKTLYDHGRTDAERLEAARQLMLIDAGHESRTLLLDNITITASPDFSSGLLDVMRQSGESAVATDILSSFEAFTPAVRKQAIDVLLAQPVWMRKLLYAIDKKEIGIPAFTVAQKSALLDSADHGIRRKANEILGKTQSISNENREKVVQELLPLAHRTGDAALGKTVFEENCKACHSIYGEGGGIAPDLTGIAGGNREEILIAIVDPNRSVEGNFRGWSVETNDGFTYSGLLADENQTSFSIYDVRGVRHTILREDVYAISMSDLSIMPEGFEALSPEQISGLIEYLTTQQEFFPLNLAGAANTISTIPMFTGQPNDDPYFERLTFDQWKNITFGGIPYRLTDPGSNDTPNLILLNSPHSPLVQEKPRTVSVLCRQAATAIHLLSGVSGWGYPIGTKGSVSMIVRLHFGDGTTEDHELLNGIHFADYIRVIDVPESQLAFQLGPHQLRHLSIIPTKRELIESIEFIKGSDDTAPIVMAVTLELP